MNVEEPTDVAPVSIGTTVATYFHSKDGNFSNQGALINLVVRLNIADGWHVYATVPQDVPYNPVKIESELPKGFRWYGDWQKPVSSSGDVAGLTEFRGDAVFMRQFYATQASSKTTIHGTIHFQACNVEKCLPVVSAPFDVPLTVYENY